MKFGEYLVSKKMIKIENIAEALIAQKYKKIPIGRILKELGHLDKDSLNRSLWAYLNAKNVIPLDKLKVMVEGLASNSELVCIGKKLKALPIKSNKQEVEFITTFYKDDFVELVETKLKKKCILKTVTLDQYSFLAKIIRNPESKNIEAQYIEQEKKTDEVLLGVDPYTKLLFECLKVARAQRASDIHIEPKEDGLQIRLRVNGDLGLWKKISKDHRDYFISAIKLPLNLDLGIVGKDQDSRASFESLKLDVRVNALPTIYGDKIVLRLLDRDQNFDLNTSGIDLNCINALKKASQSKNGLIIISGPTGSGKTTTLYSLLSSLDSDKMNISTLENPVEYRLPSISQTSISKNNTFTFSDGLRALLRQDPDIILAGEIRDKETADLAIKAASTGHLVLSSLHANSAYLVLERLASFGIDPFSVSSNLIFSCAQRLLKKLCQECSISINIEDEILKDLRLNEGNFKKVNKLGCSNCVKGIVGRIPILEYITEIEIKDFLRDRSNKSPLKTLNDYSIALAKQGLVDVSEVQDVN